MEDDASKVTDQNPTPEQDVLDSPIDEYELEYKMSHAKRGKAIIFSHWKYDEHLNLPDRDGTHADCKNLEKTLSKMNFEVLVKEDQTYVEIDETLDKVSAENHKDEDCILVAVLSHGGSGGVVYAKDGEYQVERLWGYFTAEKSPTLVAKPKIFLVQACRGEKRTKAQKVKKTQTCGSDAMPSREYSTEFKIPNHCDFVILFSTMPDFVSYRNTATGTWTVDAFCKTMNKHGYEDDFLSLLTRTCHRMITEFNFGQDMQTGCVTSMLTRKIFFKPKTDSDKGEIIEN